MNETWVSKTDYTNFHINGYVCDFIPGNKTGRSRKGRYDGGISLYYRTCLKNYITITWYNVDQIVFRIIFLR